LKVEVGCAFRDAGIDAGGWSDEQSESAMKPDEKAAGDAMIAAAWDRSKGGHRVANPMPTCASPRPAASIRRHSSAAALCSIRCRRQPERDRPQVAATAGHRRRSHFPGFRTRIYKVDPIVKTIFRPQ
jgi:hypothetical protein